MDHRIVLLADIAMRGIGNLGAFLLEIRGREDVRSCKHRLPPQRTNPRLIEYGAGAFRSLTLRSFQHFPPRELVGIIELCRRPKQALPVLYRQLIQKTPVRRELFEQFRRRAQTLQQCKLDSEICIHRGPAGMSTIIAALAKPLGRIELWKLHGTHRG